MKFVNKLLNFFKTIVDAKSREIEKNQIELKKILEETNIGDIIWANRELIHEDKREILNGHKEGPFIVVEKCEKGLVCCQGTSVEHEKYFELDNLGYNLYKKTFFRLFDLCIIDNKSFSKRLDKLTKEDFESFLKQLKINKGNYYIINGQKHKINIPIEVGDIINCDSNYLIIDIINNKYLCVPLNKSITDLKYYLNFNDFKNIDFSKVILIDIDNNIKYLNSASDNALLYVLKKQKEYIENKEKQKITQRGSVIIKDSILHYVYGEEGDNWLVFEIYKKAQPNLDMIIVNNKKYYTNYKENIIDKKSKFITTLLANDSEIDTIRTKKKSYSKIQKSKNNLPNIRVGDIIESNYYKGQRYIVIDICRKTYECVSINKLKKAIYDPILLRKIDVKLSNDKSIEGIKWLEEHPEFNLKNISTHIINIILERQEQYMNSSEYKDTQPKTKKDNTIVINGEEYVIVEKIGNMIGCSNIHDKGNKRKLLTYFNLDELDIEIPSIQKKI